MSNIDQEELDRLFAKIFKHQEKDKIKLNVVSDIFPKIEKASNINSLSLKNFIENKDYQKLPLLYITVLQKLLKVHRKTNFEPYKDLLMTILFDPSLEKEKEKVINIIYSTKLYEIISQSTNSISNDSNNNILVASSKYYVNILLNFLIFDCFFDNVENEEIFIMLNEIIKETQFTLNKYKLEFINEICCIYGFYYLIPNNEEIFPNMTNRMNHSYSLNDINISLDKKFYIMISLYNILSMYLETNFMNKKQSLCKLIILMFFFCYSSREDFLIKLFNENKQFYSKIILEIISNYKNFCFNNNFLSLDKYAFTNMDLFFLSEKNKGDTAYNNKIKIIYEDQKIKFKKWKNEIFDKIKNKVRYKKDIIENMIIFFSKLFEKEIKLSIPKSYLLKLFINFQDDSEIIDTIIKTLYHLILRNGYFLFDEWDYIFEIVKNYVEMINNKKIIQDSKLDNLFNSIYQIYIRDQFHGDVNKLTNAICSVKNFNNFWLVIFKIKLILRENLFLQNIDSVVDEYIINNQNKNKNNISSNTIVNYIIEILRNYYLFHIRFINKPHYISYNIINKIEDIFLNNMKTILSFEEDSVINCSSLAIINVLFYTKNLKFYYEVIDKLISFCNDNNKDKLIKCDKLFMNIFRDLFIKLNNSHLQKEKLLYLKKNLFNKNNIVNPIIFKCILNLFKNCIVTNDYLIHFISDKDSENSICNYNNEIVLPKCNLILDYDYNKLHEEKEKKKLSKEDYDTFKSEYYNPFISLNFNKIFNLVADELMKNNSQFANEIFEFISNCLKQIILIKLIDFQNIIFHIYNIDNFKLLNDNDIYCNKLINISTNLVYQFNYDINIENKTNNSINLLRKFKNDGLLNQFNICVTEYLLYLSENINIYINQKSNNNNTVNNNSNNLLFNIKRTIQWLSVIKIYFFSIRDKLMKKPDIDNDNIKNDINNSDDSDNEDMNNTDCFDDDNESNNNNYGNSNNIEIKTISNFNKSIYKDLVNKIINYLLDLLKYVKISQELSITIVSFIYENRDFLKLYDDDICIKCIFILFMLHTDDESFKEKVCLNYQNNFDVNNSNTSAYNYKTYKDLNTNINHSNNNSQRSSINLTNNNENKIEYIKFFSKLSLLYYFEFIKNPSKISTILQDLFVNKEEIFSPVFYYLCKWSLFNKTKRNNHLPNLNNLSWESKKLLQIYVNKKNILILHPIDNNNSCVNIYHTVYNTCLLLNRNNNPNELKIIKNYIDNIDKCIFNYNYLDDYDLKNNSLTLSNSYIKRRKRYNSITILNNKNIKIKKICKKLIYKKDYLNNTINKNSNNLANTLNYKNSNNLTNTLNYNNRNSSCSNLINPINLIQRQSTLNTVSNSSRILNNNSQLPYKSIKQKNILSKCSSFNELNENDLEEIKNEILSDSFVNKKEYDFDKKDLDLINNAKEQFNKVVHLTNMQKEIFIKLPTEKMQSKSIDIIIKTISKLNNLSLFMTYFCNVIYIPEEYNLYVNKYNLLENCSHQKVSEDFINFIGKLGKLYDITLRENSHLNIGKMSKNGEDGKYIIKYNDHFCNIIFHILNLLKGKNIKNIINNNFISIIWIENYYYDYKNIINSYENKNDKMIYIFICRLYSSFALVKIIPNFDININNNSYDSCIDLSFVFEYLFPKDFIIDLNVEDSYVQLRNIIIQLNLFFGSNNTGYSYNLNRRNNIINDFFLISNFCVTK